MRTHTAVRVERDGEPFAIDELIAPLVAEVWKAGISTVDSCQGEPEGWVRIAFPSSIDLGRFLDATAPPARELRTLHDRAETCQRRWTGRLRRRWRYTVSVIDDETPLCPECRANQARAQFDVAIILHFPVEDLTVVHRNLRAFKAAPLRDSMSLGIGPAPGGSGCRRMKFARMLFDYVFRCGPADLEIVATRGSPHGGMLRRRSWPAGTAVTLNLVDSRLCFHLPDDLEIPAEVLSRARGICEANPDDESVLIRVEGIDADSMDFREEVGERATALLHGVRARVVAGVAGMNSLCADGEAERGDCVDPGCGP
ncbi:MAG TPA: hypothetical protein PLI95_26490, partial [Polyangiaceae bacterium]|nr:hypothetical protein [Polyangiaceae bacterium]